MVAMSYGICTLSMIPLRQSHNERSDMLSQLLFGDLVEVLETRGRKWAWVHCPRYHQVGWVLQRQIKPLTQAEFEHFSHAFAYVLDLVHPVMASDHVLPVTLGARLPDFDGMSFTLDGCEYTFSGQAVSPIELRPEPAMVLKLAKRLMHAPCLRGGRSPFGIDSGGLTQLLYGLVGIELPSEPEEQVRMGESIDFADQMREGDIAYFEDAFGRVAHCGMILPGQRVLHAFGEVRVDPLDHFGIFEPQTGRYSWRLRLIKRHLMMAGKRRLLPNLPPRADRQSELFPSRTSQRL